MICHSKKWIDESGVDPDDLLWCIALSDQVRSSEANGKRLVVSKIELSVKIYRNLIDKYRELFKARHSLEETSSKYIFNVRNEICKNTGNV